MKYLLISVLLFNINSIYSQEIFTNLKIGIGSSLFNINESFDDLFLFNNSSPIIIGLTNKHLRLESTTNITLSTLENNSTYVRGSIRLSLDYISEVSDKMNIYFGPQYGLNTNETHLINLHVGGEYFLHKNWSCRLSSFGMYTAMVLMNMIYTTCFTNCYMKRACCFFPVYPFIYCVHSNIFVKTVLHKHLFLLY